MVRLVLTYCRILNNIFLCRHVYMIISEVVTLGIYAFSMIFLPEYFGSSWSPTIPVPCPELKHSRRLLNSYRSVVCHLSAVRVESGGHGGGERVTAMDHQGYQESHRTRGNDEALEKWGDRW